MEPFFGSLFFVALAEMGDKTQLVALAFATRYRLRDVIGGIFMATLLVHLFSVVIGQFLGSIIPISYIKFMAGLSFIGFGIWTLRGDELEGEHEKKTRFGPFMTVAIVFFLAELGDKTQLATVTLAAQYGSQVASQSLSFLAVWVGSTLGMVVADGLAIAVGIVLGKKLPEKFIKWVSALIFIGFGIATLAGLY